MQHVTFEDESVHGLVAAPFRNCIDYGCISKRRGLNFRTKISPRWGYDFNGTNVFLPKCRSSGTLKPHRARLPERAGRHVGRKEIIGIDIAPTGRNYNRVILK